MKIKALCVKSLALLAALSVSGITPAMADTDIQFSKFVQAIKYSGDMRLRFDQEHFHNPSQTVDRPRFRLRLRLATDFVLPSNLTLKTRLASGVGEQTSTNQTFGSLGTQKGIFIDRAFLEWKPKDWVTLNGGKMAYPLWSQYSSDAIYDADWNPEGAGENFSYLFGGVNLFFNAMQVVIDESGGTTSAAAKDQYLYSEQIGLETHLPMESRLKMAYAYHDWQNEKANAFTGVAMTNGGTSAEKSQEGNRKVGGSLANDFGIHEVTGEISSWLFHKPLSLQGTFLKNTRVSSSFVEKKNTGYQTGVIYGKAGTANAWELGYFYKYLATDVVVADAADSDFGDGGTNRQGHIMWAAYSPTDFLTFQTKYFQTKNIDTTLTGATGTIDRVQVDASVKF